MIWILRKTSWGVYFLIFEADFHIVAQTHLRFVIILPQLLESWGFKNTQPYSWDLKQTTKLVDKEHVDILYLGARDVFDKDKISVPSDIRQLDETWSLMSSICWSLNASIKCCIQECKSISESLMLRGKSLFWPKSLIFFSFYLFVFFM